MLKDEQLVYIVLELVIALLAVTGNVLVCWAVFLNSNLQSITNFFVVSLAVADIAVGLLAIPFAITISTGFCAQFFGCLFIACFVLILTQSSIFSLLAIAVDRYIAIKNPLRYNSLVTGTRAKAIIALCWFLSVGIGLTPMLGWNRGWNATAEISNNTCPEGLTVCLFEKVVTMDYMIYFNFFGCVLLPLIIMLVIYVHIFMAARRQLRLIGLKVANAPATGEIPPSSSTSRSTLQKEVHAAKSLAIIVGLFALCWLPLHIINCFHHLCEDCRRVHLWVMNIAIILSHANSVVNPLIYAYRIREFRQTFRRILYQHILGRRDGHGFAAGNGERSHMGSTSIMRTSSGISKEGSSCGTVVNSYVLDPSSDGTPTKASCHWTSKLDTAPSSCLPNGHQTKGSTLSIKQPCIMGYAEVERGTSDILEVKDSGSCISFVNVQAFSLKQTESISSSELTQVS
ncbi:adenosine A2a receptor b [Cheilinus undulatus]|uniref:adenosine A2a receptor b n=1 Tax=Cheilinus undulatus TaxID=241271 RepID=UPI001BD4C864|nr:adenosine A2a receptor b [Cheilinus undulatus]XP_041667760.1 adenosine A2a receptor b [Cheilinus undulatus]XP_041667761.1 adenosine A2a receptor b [Cheilinus undulatus]XP_041667763.1 adenosine A2a receptor b [Cheilinus undulatus]XP_041667764.1 adenosine A2a receptor b [Cheilinus undulatus]